MRRSLLEYVKWFFEKRNLTPLVHPNGLELLPLLHLLLYL
jgi:hypothetical protein